MAATLTALTQIHCSSPPAPAPLTTIRVGVLPDEAPGRLERRYRPLLEYLTVELGVPVELRIPDDYPSLLTRFEKGEIDLAYFGGLTYLKAARSSDARPLVSRRVDRRFSSYFLVRRAHPGRDLEDCAGQTLSFGPRLSTSGHLMPRSFMEARGISPEAFFAEVRYAATHDETAGLVRDGLVDIGAVNASIVDSLFDQGTLSHHDLRVLRETSHYIDYVWVAPPRLPLELRRRIRDAFLKLSPSVTAHARILSGLNAAGYLPTAHGDYDALAAVAVQTGLLD